MSWKALAAAQPHKLKVLFFGPVADPAKPWHTEDFLLARDRTPFGRLTPEQREHLYTFTFVRNPWDRFVSAWAMFSTRPARSNPRWTDFARFVELASGPAEEEFFPSVETFRNSLAAVREHTIPQTDVIAQAEADLGRPLDFIGRFEDYQADASAVLSRLGIEAEPAHLNRTEHGHYSQYYTVETRRRVAAHCEATIERFGYRYE